MKTLVIILDNIRSTYNVGAILRTCDGLGVEKVFLTGYTPHLGKGLPHEQMKLEKQLHKTALGAERSVRQEYRESLTDLIDELKSQSYKVFALEQAENSQKLGNFRDFDEKNALILGEEVHGIKNEVLELADEILEIPMCGKKESFNVSVAAGIAMWEFLKP